MKSKKIYVLDTNILVKTNGEAIIGFEDNIVVISHVVLEELDNIKNNRYKSSETRYGARMADKFIDRLCENGNPEKGIKLENGGIFKEDVEAVNTDNLPVGWDKTKYDNCIISACLTMIEQNPRKKVIMISNDTNVRNKCRSVGIEVQDYLNDRIDADIIYTGRAEYYAPSDMIAEFYQKGCLAGERIEGELIENQYVVLYDEATVGQPSQRSALGVYRHGELLLIDTKVKKGQGIGIHPRNNGQRFALDALMDDNRPLVILKGPAGCGKTYLSMAVAVNALERGKYDKVIISRSNTIPEGEELGALPGDLYEKMDPLVKPFMDNLSKLYKGGMSDVEDQMGLGNIEICPMAYIRGRSIDNTLIVVDECQNLTSSAIKTLITRAGENTKVVILGDPDQIDSVKLDSRNNGLVYCAEKMKGQEICSQVTFIGSECVRSELSKVAASIL